MPSISSHKATTLTKMLMVGDSGSGKTSSLISLVSAGYRLAILDFDNGLDNLVQLIRTKCPEKAGNIYYQTITDRLKTVQGKVVPSGKPEAWNRAMNLLTHWKTPEEDLGAPSEWGPDSVLIIDSLSFMSLAALRRILSLAGRSGKQPQIQDWGDAMREVEEMLALIYSDPFETNVLITSHIAIEEMEDGLKKGFPTAIGSKLPPKIPRYFNSMVMTQTKQGGARKIITQSTAMLDLKLAVPGVPKELPAETGLATIFEARAKGI